MLKEWRSRDFDAKWQEKELHKSLTRDRNALKRLAKSNRRLTLQDFTAKLNECKTNTFSQKTVQRVLHSEGYKRRLAKKKMVIQEANRKKRVKWCQERRARTVGNYWKKVIFSDESQIVLGTNNRVYIWRKDDKLSTTRILFVLALNGR